MHAFCITIIYLLIQNPWENLGYYHIKASNIDPGDEFGKSVAISSDLTIAVDVDGEASVVISIADNQDNNNAIDYIAVDMTSAGIASQWVYVKDSTNVVDYGKSIALSEDRSTMEVGAGVDGISEVYIN